MGFDAYYVLATWDTAENKGSGFMEFIIQREKNKDIKE